MGKIANEDCGAMSPVVVETQGTRLSTLGSPLGSKFRAAAGTNLSTFTPRKCTGLHALNSISKVTYPQQSYSIIRLLIHERLTEIDLLDEQKRGFIGPWTCCSLRAKRGQPKKLCQCAISTMTTKL